VSATPRSEACHRVLGTFSLGNAPNDKAVTANNNFYFSDTLALARGKHNLRLGLQTTFSAQPDHSR